MSDITSYIKKIDMRYINSIPLKLPAGCVLVHNNVRPTRHLARKAFEPGRKSWMTRLNPVGAISAAVKRKAAQTL